jgi:hypothetical protein
LIIINYALNVFL